MAPTGLYIQIPFCESKCSFCNFSSRVERPEIYRNYCNAVRREIERLPEIYEQQGIDGAILAATVKTIYIGGGTPALVGADLLEEIIGGLRLRFCFADSIEFTLETTPGSADEDFLRRARALGVNRLSIGAQTFDDRELKAVGRLHSSGDTRALVRSARRQGFENISLDLIAGLPHQTAESWQISLQTVRDLHSEHVSIYLFEIDEKSRLGQEVLAHGIRYHASEVPGEDFMADAYETAREFLAAAGYAQYEISNFALPGCESLHNGGYWRLEPYIGIGAGAHSFNRKHRWSNVTAQEDYTQRLAYGRSPVADFRTLSAQEQLEEFFFLGLRQNEGIDLETARHRWGTEMVSRWEPLIRNLVSDGRLQHRGERIVMAERAHLVSNEIFQEFLLV
jgi:putative oxygen-independent coproporphyrinogen III oxidase